MATLPADITVKIEFEEDNIKLSERYLVYDPFTICREDSTINRLVQETLEKIQTSSNEPDITLKIIVKL